MSAKPEQNYRIVSTDLSPDGGLETTVQAGHVEFAHDGEKLVWDDRFIERVEPVAVRDFTATVQHKLVQKTVFDLAQRERLGNRKALLWGLGLFLGASVFGAAVTATLWKSDQEIVAVEKAVSTSGDGDALAQFRK